MKNHELTALPNIGKTLAELLQSAGINSINDLSELGSEQTSSLLQNFTACLSLFLISNSIRPQLLYSLLFSLLASVN